MPDTMQKITLFVEIMPTGIKKGVKIEPDQTIASLLDKLRGKKLLLTGTPQIFRRPDQLSLIEEELVSAPLETTIKEAGIKDQVTFLNLS